MSMNSLVNHGERGLYLFDKTGKLEAIVRLDPDTNLWVIKEERQGPLHGSQYMNMDSAARAYEQLYYPRYKLDWVEPTEGTGQFPRAQMAYKDAINGAGDVD